MTKTLLVDYIAEETGLTKADSARALEAMMNGIVKGLKEDGKVTLTGFCTFTAVKKAAKTGRNPRTGEAVQIPARVAATIKAGSKLKEALN
ncbi:MAG TPA: HU family DNA-binding protein [Candidatus Fimihabitans intestinipullorum]|uniref:HU family DNA-binding protein n=1 Tax=Candidatus Fimihabitans intestinipullorum TaxID=2840820 RepID=A0A9D1HT23_9BACT|nr:HU family DNA-binding protein [Candidatus Fimihabitans intestinipullorum]